MDITLHQILQQLIHLVRENEELRAKLATNNVREPDKNPEGSK